MSLRTRLLAALLSVAVSVGCAPKSSDSASTTPPAGSTDQVICQVTADTAGQTITGVLRTTAPPVGSANGPVLTATGSSTVVTGSTNLVTVTSTAPFDVVNVYVDGLSGFFELVLPADVTFLELLIQIKQDTGGISNFDCVYSGSDDGNVGPEEKENVDIIPGGSGDLQINVTWDVESDTDLHVVEPSGEEIYWGNPNSSSGGQLDVDSNPACNLDGIKSENVFWPAGMAPSGMYTVLVDLWDACATPQSNFIVTVTRNGQSQTFAGTLSGPGTNGGAGAGQFVTAFVLP